MTLSHFNRCHIKFHTGRKTAWSWPEMNLSSIALRKTDANTSWSSTTPRRRTVATTRWRPMEASLWLSSWCRVSAPRWSAASLQPHISHLHDSNHVTLSLLKLYQSWGHSVQSCFLLPSARVAATVDHHSLTRRCTSQLLGPTNPPRNTSGCNSSVNFYRWQQWMSSDNSFLGISWITPQINCFSPHSVTLPAASGLHLFIFHPKSN